MAGVAYAGAERLALLLGLSLFFGFAFEGFYGDEMPRRPGGVRTFPLLALAGGALYLIDTRYAAAFIGGLIVVGSWIFAYLRDEAAKEASPVEGSFVVPACNLLAYLLGALAFAQPPWLCVAMAVAAVLLLGSRHRLHEWARLIPPADILTAAQFLILVGVVLPLLPGLPVIPYTSITPFGVWLAVVAVSSISYASYLVQRFTHAKSGTLWSAVLGGLYSSTATTVVLARRASEEGMTPAMEAAIVAATAMMYLRILIVCALFNFPLARTLALPVVALAALSALLAAIRGRSGAPSEREAAFSNPLQLTSAFVFALLFVAVAMLTTLALHAFGHAGVLGLAGIVGVTDIDPFVLSLAQGGAADVGVRTGAAAILIASSSNNVLKAAYAIGFSRRKESAIPAAMLGLVAAAGLIAAFWFVR
jgi:uncharacterized membrane protein (DUF4010 family)